jgi:hypothetical protein
VAALKGAEIAWQCMRKRMLGRHVFTGHVITFFHKLLNLQFIMEPGAKFAGPGDESHPRKDPSVPPQVSAFA